MLVNVGKLVVDCMTSHRKRQFSYHCHYKLQQSEWICNEIVFRIWQIIQWSCYLTMCEPRDPIFVQCQNGCRSWVWGELSYSSGNWFSFCCKGRLKTLWYSLCSPAQIQPMWYCIQVEGTFTGISLFLEDLFQVSASPKANQNMQQQRVIYFWHHFTVSSPVLMHN